MDAQTIKVPWNCMTSQLKVCAPIMDTFNLTSNFDRWIKLEIVSFG